MISLAAASADWSFEDRRYRLLDPRCPRSQTAPRRRIETDIPFAEPVSAPQTRQAGFKLSAEDLPVRRSATTSYPIFCPSFRSRMPARSTALICTNTSAPPASGWINPKPFVALNHFTVPVAMMRSSGIGRDRSRTLIRCKARARAIGPHGRDRFEEFRSRRRSGRRAHPLGARWRSRRKSLDPHKVARARSASRQKVRSRHIRSRR
jgi:hypothetical protein